jgi:GTP-binding protein
VSRRANLRNVAIIAHVDHGKTTLVDGLLKQSNVFRDASKAGTLIMDSNALEREKGITILAKNTAVVYKGVTINIIDTPGHADFGGEVERVLGMADGCLLVVDAVEGPMPQTRVVLQRALELGLRPIVVVNKVDRPSSRPAEVHELIQDLFLDLVSEPEHLEFPVLYAVGREGRAGHDPDHLASDLTPLFDAILEHVPPPLGDPDGPLQLQVSALDYDDYKGRIAIGRIRRGAVRAGASVLRVTPDGETAASKVEYLFLSQGLKRVEVNHAEAGDIVAIAGIADAGISDTITHPDHPEALPAMAIEAPTVRVTIGVNNSPLAGREGKYCTSRQLRSRLFRELETNVSLRVELTDSADQFLVSGRGELHLAILIETMRREGYEFEVSRPEIIPKDVHGHVHEPVEELIVDMPEGHIGPVTEQLSRRLAKMTDLRHDGKGRVRIAFTIPTRGLIGFRNQYLTLTRGEGQIASRLLGYEPWVGELAATRSGPLVASQAGVATTFGLQNAQVRGITFIEPGREVYEGMIIGIQPRMGDLAINVCKEKQKTNIRSSTQEMTIKMTPVTKLSLEQSLDFIEPDELLEVTPRHLRLRKRLLTDQDRARERKRTLQTRA